MEGGWGELTSEEKSDHQEVCTNVNIFTFSSFSLFLLLEDKVSLFPLPVVLCFCFFKYMTAFADILVKI